MQQENTNGSTKELLSEVHRNLVMGSEALVDVLPKVQDKFLRREITYQLEAYAAHTEKAVSLLGKYGIAPEKTSFMKSVMAKGGIALNTLLDSSDEHIAEMIHRGTDLGATQLNGVIDKLSRRGCAEPAMSLARTVVEFERTSAARAAGFVHQ